jgi:hypothetical protein
MTNTILMSRKQRSEEGFVEMEKRFGKNLSKEICDCYRPSRGRRRWFWDPNNTVCEPDLGIIVEEEEGVDNESKKT